MADVLVIGGGLAGWRAAEAAAKAGRSVALVANGAGNSPHIHALNAPVLPEDSVELHIADTMRSGHGKNDPELVRTLCEGAAELPQEFDFDRLPDGSYRLLQPLGCSVPTWLLLRLMAKPRWLCLKTRPMEICSPYILWQKRGLNVLQEEA